MKSVLARAVQLGSVRVAVCFGAALFQGNAAVSSWNPKAAARYLDQRESWWIAWPPSGRDHGTFCVSCHTAAPYALARPALTKTLHEDSGPENLRKLFENVRERVRLWSTDEPFYTDASGPGKTAQSRGTESVLNALILAAADSPTGKLGADTRTAFEHLWAMQRKSGDDAGAWPWLNFGNEPFEAADSLYYGASLAAVGVGLAPENYRSTPAIQDNLKLLRGYLNRECGSAPLIHQVVALWAAANWPGLFEVSRQRSIIQRALDKQQSDGGWSLSSLGWTWHGSSLHSLVNLWLRSNDTPWAGKSDGYATGLIVYVLGHAGVHRDDPHLQRGRSWLLHNQNPATGAWPGYSLVNRRDPNSGTGLFMSDAATAYAVLALSADQ